MTPRSEGWRAIMSTVAFLCVLALVVVAGLAFYSHRPSATKYAAMLGTVIGLYPGADVRVLGVPVGTVEKVTPMGTAVRVDFHVESDISLPAGADAALVAPTVVADRYLQISPVYTGGPKMAAGTVIPISRTASPAEFDDLLASTRKLSAALGPNGVNRNGALSGALHSLAQNLGGNGNQINTALGNFAKALTTLSANRGNLAGTVTNLQQFTGTLKNDDGSIRAFTNQFSQVSGYLAGERQDLGETLRELAMTLNDVKDFVHDNRDKLRTNVDQLSDVLRTLNNERESLKQNLDVAPVGLDGLVNAYDAASGTLHTRPALLLSIVCGLFGLFPPALQQALLPALAPILGALIPGGVAGCAPLATTPLFDQINQLINGLDGGKSSRAGTGLIPGLASLLNNGGKQLPGLPAQGAPTAGHVPSARTTPSRPPPSSGLGNLLGGGL